MIEMPDLVGDDVEIQAERASSSSRSEVGAELKKAVPGVGVVMVGQQRDFEALEVGLEMPRNAAAEIALPDVEREADAAEGVGGLEFRRARLEIVEVTRSVRPHRRGDRAVPRREGKKAASHRGPRVMP